MSSRNSWTFLKILAGVAAAAAVGGCADYLNNHDTVTLRAGDSQQWNRVVQTTDPWPPYVKNTDIDVDGQRATIGVQRYSTGTTPLESGGAASARSGSSGAAPSQ